VAVAKANVVKDMEVTVQKTSKINCISGNSKSDRNTRPRPGPIPGCFKR